jgi:hypothetical protein
LSLAFTLQYYFRKGVFNKMQDEQNLAQRVNAGRRSFLRTAGTVALAAAIMPANLYSGAAPRFQDPNLVVEKDKIVFFNRVSGQPSTYNRNSGKWIGLESGLYVDPDANRFYAVSHGTGGRTYEDFRQCAEAILNILRDVSKKVLPEIKMSDLKPGTRLEARFRSSIDNAGHTPESALEFMNTLRHYIPMVPPEERFRHYFDTGEGNKLHVLWGFNDFHAYSRLEMESGATPIPVDQLKDYAPMYKAFLVKSNKVVKNPLDK